VEEKKKDDGREGETWTGAIVGGEAGMSFFSTAVSSLI
jgi:hypothetical protein